MALTSNKAVLSWIDEMSKMTQPANTCLLYTSDAAAYHPF